MPHDIIDNREEKLSDHIGRLLENAEKEKSGSSSVPTSARNTIQ